MLQLCLEQMCAVMHRHCNADGQSLARADPGSRAPAGEGGDQERVPGIRVGDQQQAEPEQRPRHCAASSPKDRLDGLEHDEQVEAERDVLDVVEVVLEFFPAPPPAWRRSRSGLAPSP